MSRRDAKPFGNVARRPDDSIDKNLDVSEKQKYGQGVSEGGKEALFFRVAARELKIELRMA
jgi:hypothetical protein